MQFTVPCGTVDLFANIIGLGPSGNYSTRVVLSSLSSSSWRDSDEDLFLEVQTALLLSPNDYLETVHLYSTLRTMVLSCFPDVWIFPFFFFSFFILLILHVFISIFSSFLSFFSPNRLYPFSSPPPSFQGTFVPVDPNNILTDILDSDPPDTIQGVLDEAPLLSIVGDPSQGDEIFDRFNDYLDVINNEGTLQDGDSLSDVIVDGVSGLFEASDDDDLRDDGYDVLGNVQSTLLCLMECGEDPVVVEGDAVTIGAQSGTLQQLAGTQIALGNTGAYFLFPEDVSELEEAIGEGECVYTGTSFVSSNDPNEIPAASFTFYTLNCTTGEREEVAVTLGGEFVIVIPLPEDLKDDEDNSEGDCGEEDQASCISGDTLSSLDDTIGCRVIEVLEDQIVCGCTHLTAFSALFVPGGGGACGGEWEWGTLQTVAATLIAFMGVFIVCFLLAEHFLVFKQRKMAIKSKTRRSTK